MPHRRIRKNQRSDRDTQKEDHATKLLGRDYQSGCPHCFTSKLTSRSKLKKICRICKNPTAK